jgi:hypothetical protein
MGFSSAVFIQIFSVKNTNPSFYAKNLIKGYFPLPSKFEMISLFLGPFIDSIHLILKRKRANNRIYAQTMDRITSRTWKAIESNRFPHVFR